MRANDCVWGENLTDRVDDDEEHTNDHSAATPFFGAPLDFCTAGSRFRHRLRKCT